MTTAIFCAMFTLNQGAIDLFRVKFLSNGRAPIYTQAIRTSQQLFHNAQSAGENQHATRVFCKLNLQLLNRIFLSLFNISQYKYMYVFNKKEQ